MALDSDTLGADARLAVKFYQREVRNDFQSEKEGRPIYDMRDYIRIEVPGDRNTIIDSPVNKGHQDRFPMQWARYQNDKRDIGAAEVQGTMLRDWSLLTAAQAAELKHFQYYTVEQVASASDEQIGRIGMSAGMGAFALRDKAKAYLAHAKDSSFVQAQAEELRKRDEELAALRRQVEELARQVEAPKEVKRGRPVKQDEQVT